MTRILNAEPLGYSPDARAILAGLGEVVEHEVTRDELLAEVGEFDILITRLAHRIDAEVFDAAPNLRAVVTATTGLDHIDVQAAEGRGVTVLSLRGQKEFLRSVTATAEHTWALLLAVVRHLPDAVASVRSGEWDRDAFRGEQLAGKRLGIVGMGRVGSQVAGYGIAFGMRVAGFDPRPEGWPQVVDVAPDLATLLSSSDVLAVHVPLEGNEGMLGTAEFSAMPRGAFVVNTSRGEVLDEAALVEALASGHLAGAGLDVLTNELDPALREASPALAYARDHAALVITPHIAGATAGSMEKTEVFMAQQLASFLEQA